ncbi:hypothetical protein ACOZ4Y_11865 [Komagataeibacter rhaeticus]
MKSVFEGTVGGRRHIGVADSATGKLHIALEQSAGEVGLLGFLLATDDPVEKLSCSTTLTLVEKKDVAPLPYAPLSDSALVQRSFVTGFARSHKSKARNITSASGDCLPPPMFIKGDENCLQPTDHDILMPKSFIHLCEEAEIVLIYWIGPDREPKYVGYTFGNDVTDIGRVKEDFAQIGYAKLCPGGIENRIWLGRPPSKIEGSTAIERSGVVIWEGTVRFGLDDLAYNADDLLAELWNWPNLRVERSLHYIFLGADRSSNEYGHSLRPGDISIINIPSYGVQIRNKLVASMEGSGDVDPTPILR